MSGISNSILLAASQIVVVLPLPAGFQSDYNIVMDRFSTDDGGSVITLAEWQALGLDLNSQISDPAALFLNPGGDDYHLLTSGPAYEFAPALGDVLDDIDGQSRPFGPLADAGADEWVDLPLSFFLPAADRDS